MTSEIYSKPILIFGCGNTLLGNDGFGPAVIQELTTRFALPDGVLAIDAGTGIRDFMFDLLLMEQKPNLVIIVDAVTIQGRKNGELREIDLSSVPIEKMSNFALHQAPSSNLLKALKASGRVEVRVLGVHTEPVSNVIDPGLSPEVESAIPGACQWILDIISNQMARQTCKNPGSHQPADKIIPDGDATDYN